MIKVLVVDDEEIVRRSIANALLNRDYMVLQAKSGPVALTMCEIERPDVILLDVLMPEMDGFEVVEKLRENPDTKEIPVVIVSALSEQEVKHAAKQYAVKHYISKPWTADSLDVTIQLALGIPDRQPK